ncbi:uncharacterized protein N7477_006694 [Penicillium maclennaniae]|uniref:uncharacterized protein n=1 Tax=Penicillium maclennaniae TaxID=1343394 RepID=UPI0025423904|nr:uncharacterized protein N7477_006694 [Penicillium maclennaniae]KAJ5668124.1 hypothetical protein N7477_006694 [Penicillium maclennaniae]
MATLTDPSNSTRSTPNISSASATLQLGSSTTISAPSSKVWSALTNTSTWPNWNSFVPRVTIRSHPGSESSDLPLSPILQNGTRMIFHVRMDPSSSKPQAATDVNLIVTEFVEPNVENYTPGRIVWASDFDAPGTMARSLLNAERVHEIRDVEGGTEVRNWECQVGWVVYAVKWMYGGKLKHNFELWVNDLKKFVEASS